MTHIYHTSENLKTASENTSSNTEGKLLQPEIQESKSKKIQEVVKPSVVKESPITQPIKATIKSDSVIQRNEKKSLVESIIHIIGTKSNFDMDYKYII